jgi:hypothetical protein
MAHLPRERSAVHPHPNALCVRARPDLKAVITRSGESY